MRGDPPGEVTELLQAWRGGDQGALDRLIPLIHAELHRLAHHYMLGERAGHTLQTTALINEAYLRLVNASQITWENRAHFLAVSANLMRRTGVPYLHYLTHPEGGFGKCGLPWRVGRRTGNDPKSFETAGLPVFPARISEWRTRGTLSFIQGV